MTELMTIAINGAMYEIPQELAPMIMRHAEQSPFLEYGLAGSVIAALFTVIILMNKQNSEERKEWRETYKSISQLADERQKETNAVIRELTAVIERRRGDTEMWLSKS